MTDEVGTVPAFDEEAGTVPAERADVEALINAYADARAAREEVSAQEKRLREIEEKAEQALFTELEHLNLRAVRHERGLFTLNDLAWPKIVDPSMARQWAELEHPDLITLNATRLGPFIREALKEGLDLPPGVEATFSRKINWRRS
jgi:hypothetical protein